MADEELTRDASWNFTPPQWQAPLWDNLSASLAVGRLGQAILLTGPAGVGKQAFAQTLTAALLCDRTADSREQGTACGQCASCSQLAAGSHPDFSLLAPLPDKRWINIDQIRSFSSRLRLKSQNRNGRVGLIAPADALQAQAANALLKTLEEPAAGNHLILLSQRPAQLLPTIRSRCRLLRLPVPDVAAAEHWLQTQSDITAGALALAGNAPLEALRRQQAGISQHYAAWFTDLLRFLRGRGDATALAFHWKEQPQRELLAFIGLICCDLLRMLGGAEAGRARSQTQTAALKSLLPAIDAARLAENLPDILRARRLQESNADKQLILEDLLIRMADSRLSSRHMGET